MDDPWGSPWADEIAQPLSVPKAATEQGLVTSPRPFQLSEGSRWDDEEDFGEWAPLPATELETGILTRADEVSVDQWTVEPDHESTQAGRDGERDARQDWFKQDTQASNQTHAALSILQSDGSQASPEPWRKEKLRELEALPSAVLQTADIVEKGSSREFMLNGDSGDDKSTKHTSLTSLNQTRQGKDQLVIPGTSILQADTPLAYNECELTSEYKTNLNRKPNSPGKGVSQTCRLSTSTSGCSPHDEAFAESPRTSFDEEIELRPNGEAKLRTNGTVKVSLHDNLGSRAANTDLGEGLREDERQDDGVIDPGPTVSQGDLEVLQDLGNKPSNNTIANVMEPKELSPEEMSTLQPTYSTNTAERLECPRLSLSDEELIMDENGRSIDLVAFDVDLDLIPKLFVQGATVPAVVTSGTYDLTEIESVIQDSFCSTEQRKVWHRISRYGSMGKHNAGDDDNYVRIGWNHSDIRTESIKIVAGWMEEDRSGGDLAARGSGRSGSLFGWGQKHPAPIGIAEVLAKKSGKTWPSPDSIMQQEELQIPEGSELHGKALKANPSDSYLPLKQTSQSTSTLLTPKFSWSTGTPAPNTGQKHISSERAASSQRSIDIEPEPRKSLGQGPFGRVLGEHPPSSSSSLFRQPVGGGNDSSISSASGALNLAIIKERDEGGEWATASPTASKITSLTSAQHSQALDGLGQAWGSDHTFVPHYLPPASNSFTEAPNSYTGVQTESSDANSGFGSSRLRSPSQPVTIFATASRPIQKVATPVADILASNDEMPKEESEHDRIVKSIVQNLPNLSYMLRR